MATLTQRSCPFIRLPPPPLLLGYGCALKARWQAGAAPDTATGHRHQALCWCVLQQEGRKDLGPEPVCHTVTPTDFHLSRTLGQNSYEVC